VLFRSKAEDFGRQARGAILRLGGDPRREASRLSSLCRAHERAGLDLAHAHALCQQALDLLRREQPEELYTLSIIEERLGNVLVREERYPDAERMYRDAIEKRQKSLPAGSHLLVNTRGNLAESLVMQGHYPEAIEIFKELVQAHPWWHLYDGLALAYWRTTNIEQAISSQRLALAACRENDPRGLCGALASIRLAEYLLPAATEEARELLEYALALRKHAVQLPPFDEARTHLLLARIERAPDKIKAHHERAIELITPVAHRGGNHQVLLEAARSPGRPLPAL
jgi:tetratricopeptide (TPR) repeat protein